MSTALVTQGESLIKVIAAAASNPNCDIDKMQALLGMHERVTKEGERKEYYSALSRMQGELPSIDKVGQIKDKSGRVQSRYAKWEDINQVLKPILSTHGFSLSFLYSDNGLRVTAILAHTSGHAERSETVLPADTTGNKSDVQAIGSSQSYAKRYLAIGILNITTHGEDDDGNGGRGLKPEDHAADDPIVQFLEAAAKDGLDALSKAWGSDRMTPELRKVYSSTFGRLKREVGARGGK